ncbi:hypothetical protein [Streptomyces fumanus]|uniref:Uncharacterized protein n=1 Tax=Streptomyces fumanus TaxID=67302 RepID=A0A919E1M3_9ACTN|nr:hypothetical protein [Streptomyces fumanus]GHF01722.1 hypothetical protein GCM10018772_28290 [Streptomyces fumanus]
MPPLRESRIAGSAMFTAETSMVITVKPSSEATSAVPPRRGTAGRARADGRPGAAAGAGDGDEGRYGVLGMVNDSCTSGPDGARRAAPAGVRAAVRCHAPPGSRPAGPPAPGRLSAFRRPGGRPRRTRVRCSRP